MTDTLDTYTPTGRAVTVNGQSLRVTPLRARQISAFSAAVSPLLAALERGDIVAVVTEHTDALIRAAAIATGQSEEAIGEATLDELAELTAAIVEVNLDFFVHRLAPVLGALTARLTPTPTPGATPSPP